MPEISHRTTLPLVELPLSEDDRIKVTKKMNCPICQMPFSEHYMARADSQMLDDTTMIIGYAITSKKNDIFSGWCFVSDHNEFYKEAEKLESSLNSK